MKRRDQWWMADGGTAPMSAAVMTTATTISRARKERTERARRDGSDPLRGRRRVPWRSMDIPSSGGGSDPRMRPARSHRRGRCLRYGPSRSNPLSWPSTDRSMAGMRATWPSPRRRTPSGRTSPADGRRKHLDVHSGRTVAGGCVQACRSRHPGRPGRHRLGSRFETSIYSPPGPAADAVVSFAAISPRSGAAR